MGLRANDLNPVGRALLKHYARLTAKVVLLRCVLRSLAERRQTRERSLVV